MSPSPVPITTNVTTKNYQSRSQRRVQEERGGSKRIQPERSMSFHGRTMAAPAADQRHMRRPKTQPDLLSGGRWGASMEVKHGKCGEHRRVPAKVLVNVTVQRSPGPVQVMASTEWTVEDLVAAAVRLYVKEGRRPPLPTTESSAFGLHYSQFSLECLDPKEMLMELGSRNFFLCPKFVPSASAQALDHVASSSRSSPPPLPSSSTTSCSKEAGKAWKMVIPWLGFMDFLL